MGSSGWESSGHSNPSSLHGCGTATTTAPKSHAIHVVDSTTSPPLHRTFDGRMTPVMRQARHAASPSTTLQPHRASITMLPAPQPRPNGWAGANSVAQQGRAGLRRAILVRLRLGARRSCATASGFCANSAVVSTWAALGIWGHGSLCSPPFLWSSIIHSGQFQALNPTN